MNILQKVSKFLLLLIVLVGFSQCKTQNGTTKVPFEITEKIYFNFTGGKKGTSGTTIKVVVAPEEDLAYRILHGALPVQIQQTIQK